MNHELDGGRWADWHSTCALTGIQPCDLAWAMARGQVEYAMNRPGHEGVPMVLVDDVQRLVGGCPEPPQLRIVRDI